MNRAAPIATDSFAIDRAAEMRVSSGREFFAGRGRIVADFVALPAIDPTISRPP